MALSALRSLGSVALGLAAAFVFVVGAEAFSAIFHPFPAGVDPTDYEACKAHVARYPTWVLAVCTAIWALAPFTGSWVATRLGANRHAAHGLVVGAILLALAAFNMAMLPYPVWFPVVNSLTFPIGTILGIRLAKNRSVERKEPPEGELK